MLTKVYALLLPLVKIFHRRHEDLNTSSVFLGEYFYLTIDQKLGLCTYISILEVSVYVGVIKLTFYWQWQRDCLFNGAGVHEAVVFLTKGMKFTGMLLVVNVKDLTGLSQGTLDPKLVLNRIVFGSLRSL